MPKSVARFWCHNNQISMLYLWDLLRCLKKLQIHAVNAMCLLVLEFSWVKSHTSNSTVSFMNQVNSGLICVIIICNCIIKIMWCRNSTCIQQGRLGEVKGPAVQTVMHTWKQLLGDAFFFPPSFNQGSSGSDVCRQLHDVSQHLFNCFIRPRFLGATGGF